MIYSNIAKQHNNNSAERRFNRGYNIFYDALLNHVTPKTFLELGISKGNNLVLWSDILKDSVKIGVELLNPSQSVSSFIGDSSAMQLEEYKEAFTKAMQLEECKEAFNKYLDYGSKHNNKWYFGWNAFAIETVKEITNNHGKLDLIINDAKHGVKVWKMLDIWKDALTDNGIIITEEKSCATREQIPNGDLINDDQVNLALEDGWEIYNFNTIRSWKQPNCLIGYWSKNKLNLEELDTYKYS